MIRKILTTFTLVLLVSGAYLHAQVITSSQQNIFKQKQFQWKQVNSKFIEVHYYGGDPSMATMVLRYAEEALFDVGKLLDYRNRSKYSFYLFDSPEDLAGSNQFPYHQIGTGGVTPIRNNISPVVYPGSSSGLQAKVKSHLTKMMIEDFYFGGGIQATIQNSVLLHLPAWFGEGLPAFVGEGWSTEDELWISSMENANLMDYALEGNEPINHLARKSIWQFIVSNYGRDKLSEIYYMTRLTRSVEGGIIHVLGITLKTLTERWREYLYQKINENNNYRDQLKDKASQVRLPDNEQMMGFALHPTEAKMAILLEKEGKQHLVIRDLHTGNMTETGLKGGYRTNQFQSVRRMFPMEWDHSGNFLTGTMYSDVGEQIFLYNAKNGSHKFTAYRPTLQRLLSISWSHDDSKVVYSALRNGAVDLFLSAPGSNAFRDLTKDFFDNLNPVWSPDDQSIYFASNRGDSLTTFYGGYDDYKQKLDIYRVDVANNKGEITRITNTPTWTEIPMEMPSSFEILYRTDRTGVFNLEKQNVFLGDRITLSNMVHGIRHAQISDSLIAFSAPLKGQLQLYFANSDDFLTEPAAAMNTLLRMQTDKAHEMRLKAGELKARRDSIAKAKETSKERIKNGIPDGGVKSDTTKEKPAVKYYVFDGDEEEEVVPKNKRQYLKAREALKKKKERLKPDYDTLAISRPTVSRKRWAADRVVSAFSFDPIFKLNLYFEARMKDASGDHSLEVGFRPFFDFKSSDFHAIYGHLKNKLDIYSGIARSSRFLANDEYALRYTSNKVFGSAVYPLSRFASISGGLHFNYINRIDLEPGNPQELDANDLVTGLNLNYTWDHRNFSEGFTKSGEFLAVNGFNNLSITNTQNNFFSLNFDARKYFPVMKNFVLAARLFGGMSVGTNPQEVFMGGTDEGLFTKFANIGDLPINNQTQEFSYMSFITPVRGFQFNARNGTKYAASNIELRIPVSRMFANSLNSNPLFNVEVIPFFDIGTTWRTGNPLSQKNPIETEYINSYPLAITVQTLKSPFIMGFGAGARMNLFGYNMRFDLGWGVEDYTLANPRLHLSLGKNF